MSAQLNFTSTEDIVVRKTKVDGFYNVEEAKKLGTRAASILQAVRYTTEYGFGGRVKMIEGEQWMHMTYAQCSERVGIPETTCKRIILKLEKGGLLCSYASYTLECGKGHKTKWYKPNHSVSRLNNTPPNQQNKPFLELVQTVSPIESELDEITESDHNKALSIITESDQNDTILAPTPYIQDKERTTTRLSSVPRVKSATKEPVYPPVVVSSIFIIEMAKLIAGISARTWNDWVNKHGEEYVREKAEYVTNKNPRNPGGYLRMAIEEGYKVVKMDVLSREHIKAVGSVIIEKKGYKTVYFATDEENVEWYTGLSQDEKLALVVQGSNDKTFLDLNLRYQDIYKTSPLEDSFVKSCLFLHLMVSVRRKASGFIVETEQDKIANPPLTIEERQNSEGYKAFREAHKLILNKR